MEKKCEFCDATFSRPSRVSEKQWRGRRYCSSRCAGRKDKALSDEEIGSLYIGGLSANEIAPMAGVTHRAILSALDRVGIPRRSASEGKKIAHSRPETKAKMSAAALGRPCPAHVKEILSQRVGAKNPLWRGGVTTTAAGYLQFTASSANGVNAGKYLHRVIAESTLGRPLVDGEVVHHKDGDKLNNSPSNLEVMAHSDHAKLHSEDNHFWEHRSNLK